MRPKIGSLFSGYGGLDLGVQAALGGDVVWHCENEDAPSRILAHHWPGVPNLGDITEVDWDNVEPVDIITAGWPCQPWSTAGKRKGIEDDRALWPEVARAVRMVRPRLLVLENVPTIITAGELQRVADSLAEVGYDLRWTCLRASDVGAAHRRERIFILGAADTDGATRRERWLPAPGQAEGGRPRTNAGGRGGAPTTNAEHGGRPRRPSQPIGRSTRRVAPTGDSQGNRRGGQAATDTPIPEQRGTQPKHLGTTAGRTAEPRECASPIAWGSYELAIRRAERAFGRPAPDPTEPGARGGRRLSPRFVEWHMGLPPGWVTDVPGLTRNDQLRALGNGVVPQQAAMALRWLLSLDEERAA